MKKNKMENWEAREEIVKIRAKYTTRGRKFTDYRAHDTEVWDLERKYGKSIKAIEDDVGILYGEL